tara:strand:+ start:1531 stop:1728 length:198 start_codon:yes stop_codon:yes gene_type:complete
VRDDIDIFIDSTLAWSEQKQAMVLAVDKYQFEKALRKLVNRSYIDGIIDGITDRRATRDNRRPEQ